MDDAGRRTLGLLSLESTNPRRVVILLTWIVGRGDRIRIERNWIIRATRKPRSLFAGCTFHERRDARTGSWPPLRFGLYLNSGEWPTTTTSTRRLSRQRTRGRSSARGKSIAEGETPDGEEKKKKVKKEERRIFQQSKAKTFREKRLICSVVFNLLR